MMGFNFLRGICLISGFIVGLTTGQGCPWGWVDFPSSASCYFLSDPVHGYNNVKASTKCRSHQSELVRIDNKNELDWLKTQLKTFGSSAKSKKFTWWLGLRSQGDNLEYLDGVAAESYITATIPPSSANYRRGKCGLIAWNGTISTTEGCFKLWIGYICERSKNTSLTCDVDNQWMYSNGACYKTFSPQRTWGDSRRFCAEQDADLAKVDNRESLAMLWDLAKTNNKSKYWLGLRADGKQYQWTDNTKLASAPSFWNKGEPKSVGSKRTPMCVAVDGNLNRRLASFVTMPCSKHAAFACSKKPGVCADGWLQHQTSCLKFDLTLTLTWTAARSYCRFIGGDLIMLKSRSDQAFIDSYTGMMKDDGISDFWLGLSDEKGVSDWFWSDGVKLNSSLADWARTRTKNIPGTRDCAYVNTASTQWRTTPQCSRLKAFVCEIPAGKIVKPAPVLPAADQCESGWEAAGSYCLKFHGENSTWYQAFTNCQSEEAEMLMVSSDYVQAFLEGNLVLGETFWLGLSDREKEGEYVWVNGSKVVKPKWAAGEPSSEASKNCVVVQSDGQSVIWKMDSCQSTHKYICSKNSGKPRRRRMSPAVTVPYSEACGKGWELRSSTNYCYQFRDTQNSYMDARDVCSHHNGSLVSITSRDEQSYIEGRLKVLSLVSVWIGANDRVNEAGWTWEDGAPFKYLNWFPGEPNNFGNSEDCGAINIASMAWYDYDCSLRAGFICKKKADSETTVTTSAPTTVSIPDGKFYGCAPGWLAIESNCYLLRKTEVSWLDGQKACWKESAQLASISSFKENQNVFSFLPKVSCQNLHSNSSQCKAWADLGECQKNPRWMSLNCKASCSFCKQTCSDIHTANECRYWASIGECSKNDWMSKHCSLSCGCDRSINYGFWIGLNDRQSQMSFAWSDFSSVDFTNWAKNEPNNYNGKNEDCVKMISLTGQWSDEVCSEKSSGYICKKKMEILAHPTQSPNQVGCPIGSFGYGPMCFLIVDLPMTWQESRRYCNQRTAELATITDRTTAAFITSELVGKTTSYWLGLRSVGTTYSWISGRKITYMPWAPSHTGNGNNTCVVIRSQRPVGLWEDSDCQNQQPFICEILRKGYTTPPPTTPSMSTYPTTQKPCADGWKGFGNNCYKLHTEVKTWSEAQDTCALYGGSLTSIHDSATQNFLATQLTYLFNPDSVWIGLSDAAKEATYKWTDGSPFDYSKWGPNEPNNAYATEDCVQLYRSGNYWNDQTCFTSAAFICSVSRDFPIPSVLPTVVVPPALTCGDSGWMYRGGFCYYVSPPFGSDSKLTWFEANRKCMSLGGHLASIASQAEDNFILKMISKTDDKTSGKFWIGFNELGSKSYRWSDGSPPIYLAWSLNEPNDAWGGQKCVNMYADSGRWNDDNCMDPLGYVCKKLNGTAFPNIPVPTPAVKTPCPPGFQGTGLNNKCYFLAGLGATADDSPVDWKSARDKCRALGSSTSTLVDIASIGDRSDQDLVTLLIRDLKSAVWIGFSDEQSHRAFRWQDNSEVTFTNWGQGEPSDHWSQGGERDCVLIMTDPTVDPTGVGKWKIENCGRKNAYLCQTIKVPSQGGSTSPTTVTTEKQASSSSQCPSNYYMYSNTCFNLVPQLKTWQEARKSCQFFGGDLASTLDVFEMARLDLDVYIHRIMKQVWIGLSYNTERSTYQWSDGWPLESTFWSKNDPDRQTNNSCVALDNGRWNDTDCTFHRPFVCAIRKGTPPTPSPTPTGHCRDSSQTLFGDFCYLPQLSSKVSWPEAVYACGELGMELVSVLSLQESSFLFKLLKTQSQGSVKLDVWNSASPTSKVWIGLTRDGNDGFRWSDKSDINFFHWASGEPSSKMSSTNFSTRYDESCVEMDTDSAKWSDVDCLSKRQNYVCKVKKVMQSTISTVTGSKSSMGSTPLGPQTQRYHGSGIGHSTLKEPKSGLTAGQIVGIALGAICFFILVAATIFLVRQKFQFNKLKAWAFNRDPGFDNALYKHHAGRKGDESVEENDLDQMSPENRVTLGSTFA